MKVQNPRGTRDCLPEEQIIRDEIVAALKNVFESYGYLPLDTPAFERYELLASKYAGGDEILKETFKFTDQGKRELGLRYDLTVPLARVVAQNPNLTLPFRRYQIGKVWRDGPVEATRYREFIQCDADIVGSSSPVADAEVICIVNSAFENLELPFVIKINSIKLLNDILQEAEVDKEKTAAVILSLDKLEKIGKNSVVEELNKKGIKKEAQKKIFDLIEIDGTNEEKINALKNKLKSQSGIAEIEEVLGLCNNLKNLTLDLKLARGLSYYTGIIIETFLKSSSVKTSVCSGGRYDKLLGSFAGNREYSALGVSFGLDRIYDAMVEKRITQKKTLTRILFVPIRLYAESIKICDEIRKQGINVELAIEKSISANLNYANSKGIPFVAIYGEKEKAENKIKIRNMETGEEKLVRVEEIGSVII